MKDRTNHSRVDDKAELQRQDLADDNLRTIPRNRYTRARLETSVPRRRHLAPSAP